MILTEEQQKSFATHIQYEIDEFRNSIKRLDILKKAGRTDSESGWNRTLESLLFHLRSLRAFFYGEGRDPESDVFATHYVSSWKAEKDPVFKATSQHINKRLAHLTIERLEVQPGWPLDEMNAAMEKLISEFRKSLSPEQAEWFPRLEDESAIQTVFGDFNYSTTPRPMQTVTWIGHEKP